MRTFFSIRRLLAGLVLWAVVGFAWFCFAPPALGGETNYVVTDGISMEPRFHGGDLVLVRAEKSYRVGQIVAYRSKALDTVVLHRIIGINGSHYIFKGDNNNFVDIEHPTQSELVGTLWLHVPGKYVGALAPLRDPPVLGGLVALSSILIFGGAFTAGRRSRKRRRTFQDGKAPVPERHRHLSPAVIAGDVVIGGVAVLLASAAVASVAFTHRLSGPAPTSIPYTQSGAFSYTSSSASGPAYPGGRVVTGDPVFIKLVHDVNMLFTYRFSAAARHQIAGTASLKATISSTSGWKKTLVLQAPTRFTGDRAVVSGTLLLGPLMSVLRDLEQTTQVSGSYTLSLAPHVSIAGTIGGFATHTVFSAPLTFSLDQLELQPLLSSGGSSTGQAGGTSSLLKPSISGSVTGTIQQPRTLAFGPASVRVSTARTIAVDGLTLGICLLLGGLALMIRASLRRGADLANDILGRYGRLLVRVTRAPRPSASDLVELDDMETLVRIAERYDRMILHERMMGADTFCVPEDGIVYRYAIPSEVLFSYPPEVLQFLAARTTPPVTVERTVADISGGDVRVKEEAGDVRWGPWSAPATQRQPAA